MLAVPLLWLVVGVNTAVRVRPVPLIALKVPPVTTTSPEVPSHAKLVSGSSEKEKVMFAVVPTVSVEMSEVMATVGPVVSTMNAALLVTANEPMLQVLPLASLRVAPLNSNALAGMAMPSVSVWPLTMVVVNTKALVPAPDT